MARVPVEVLDIAGRGAVASAVGLANAAQDDFDFALVAGSLLDRASMLLYERTEVEAFFDQLAEVRNAARGYHPFLICMTDSALDGRKYTNLFGSHRAIEGLAVVTDSQVPDIIVPSDRMAAYYVYYLARYALSFLTPRHRNHEDPRGCIFDRKVDKSGLVGSMRGRPFCDDCRRTLVAGDGSLSPEQFASLDKLFALAGEIMTNGIDRGGRRKVFIGSSTEGLDIANKIQELLAYDFSVTVWNQGTVFGLGQSTLESLEAAVYEYFAGIFVFTPDDETTMRGTVKPVARDNVLFELGMFVGKLGRFRAFALTPGSAHLAMPTDLMGITTAHYHYPVADDVASSIGPAVNQIRHAIKAVNV